MLKRWIAGAIAIFTGANGLAMLADGPHWYAVVPGVVETGSFNAHFVADIGAAYFAAALALGARAWRDSLWPAGLAGAGFFALHALIHVAGIASGDLHHAVFDSGAVILPAALAVWAALPTKGKGHAEFRD